MVVVIVEVLVVASVIDLTSGPVVVEIAPRILPFSIPVVEFVLKTLRFSFPVVDEFVPKTFHFSFPVVEFVPVMHPMVLPMVSPLGPPVVVPILKVGFPMVVLPVWRLVSVACRDHPGQLRNWWWLEI